MLLPYSEELNIEYLGRLFDNTSECYKFFWFKAIVSKVCIGQFEMTYEELVDEMIVDAWYMVSEFHLNLGPKDTLEALVNLIKERYPEIRPCAKKSEILEFLRNTTDRDIISKKRTLTYNVPYRLQAPFMNNLRGTDWNVSQGALIERINQEKQLLYYFQTLNGLSTVIVVQEDWARYIIKNQELIRGWLEYNMIHYLQRRNPSVPGIADKLYPPLERKLEKVKKYWKIVMSLAEVRDIYSNQIFTERDLSIDHFIPWSYVAHDEMWNLNPTTRSVNSSKSNNLPDWNTYFEKLARQEYQSYGLMWQHDILHREFDKCAKEHINSDDVRHKVYRQGLEFHEFTRELETIIMPVYKSAQNCGFGNWRY